MTAETEKAVEAAVAAHVAAEGDGATLLGFVLYAAGQTVEQMSAEGEAGDNPFAWYVSLKPSGQLLHTTVGLANMLAAEINAKVEDRE